ncbi:MAG: peptide ABC transporter substrate-binding protein [Candidatus Kuenenbacteria bacterium]
MLLPKISSGFQKITRKLQKDKPTSDENENNKTGKNQIFQFPSLKQIKYLPKFLSLREKIIIGAAGITILVCVFLIGLLFWKANFIDKPAIGGTYTEGIIGSPQKINPLYSSTNEADRDIVKLVFSGLIKFDDNGTALSDLAQDWFIDESQTKYTFSLREDIQWPDEKPFTSEDVVFTLNAIQNPDYQSPLRSSWENIAIEAIDLHTVQFTLPKPFQSFLKNLSVGILPAHLWQDIKPENALLAELNSEPIGLGMYKFDSYTKDKQGYIKSYSLIKNENYHIAEPFIKQITFRFYPNFELAIDALKNKNIDGLNFLPQNLKEKLETRKDLNYYSLSLPQYTAVFFNQQKNELLKINKFKEALNLSIDKDKIISTVLSGEARLISSPILPGFPGYERQSESTFNVEQAKKILQDLGWAQKEITADEKNNQDSDPSEDDHSTTTPSISIETDANGLSKFLYKNDLELTINLTLADQPQSVATAELIQKYWQAIGVKTNLHIIDPKQIQKDIIAPRNFEALLFGEILGNDSDLYAFWHSSQAGENGLNLADFKNSEADNLLEKAMQETDIQKKADYYIKFQNILTSQMPAIFLYTPNYTYVVADKIKGIKLTHILTPTDRLINIDSWYIRTKKGLK